MPGFIQVAGRAFYYRTQQAPLPIRVSHRVIHSNLGLFAAGAKGGISHWIMGVPTLSVVPANAKTHNPWSQQDDREPAPRLPLLRWWLWVPAQGRDDERFFLTAFTPMHAKG